MDSSQTTVPFETYSFPAVYATASSGAQVSVVSSSHSNKSQTTQSSAPKPHNLPQLPKAFPFVPILSKVLSQICASSDETVTSTNNNAPRWRGWPQNSDFKEPFYCCFESASLPNISVEDYLKRIVQHTRATDESLVTALIYIDRLISKHAGFTLHSTNFHRLFLTATLLSSKFFEDSPYNNAFWAKVGGVSAQDLFKQESQFTQMIEWNFEVSPKLFFNYFQEMYKFAESEGALYPQFKAPAPVAAPARRTATAPSSSHMDTDAAMSSSYSSSGAASGLADSESDDVSDDDGDSEMQDAESVTTEDVAYRVLASSAVSALSASEMEEQRDRMRRIHQKMLNTAGVSSAASTVSCDEDSTEVSVYHFSSDSALAAKFEKDHPEIDIDAEIAKHWWRLQLQALPRPSGSAASASAASRPRSAQPRFDRADSFSSNASVASGLGDEHHHGSNSPGCSFCVAVTSVRPVPIPFANTIAPSAASFKASVPNYGSGLSDCSSTTSSPALSVRSAPVSSSAVRPLPIPGFTSVATSSREFAVPATPNPNPGAFSWRM